MRKLITALSFLSAILVFSAGTAFATQAPDLRVQSWQGPSSAMVKSPYQYTVVVRNTGNRPAAGVKLVVDLPLTDTSPNKYILGKISGFNTTDCRILSNKLNCDLYSMNQNQTKQISFIFELPVSTKTLTFTAKASTTTANENQAGNTLSHTPVVAYGTRQISGPVDVLVSHCTGRGLSSYSECELFPSSIASFVATLDGNQAITSLEYGNLGMWDQFTSNQRLHMQLTDGTMFADFNGFSTGGNCFEGMTFFTPSSPYSSPYKVCIQ